jgi:hypothetical protein
MTFEIYFGFELLALFIALVKYRSLLESEYKFFIPFLILIVLYETGSLYNKFSIGNNNTLATNFITGVEFTFYSFFIRNTLKSHFYKKVILIAIFVCLGYNIINYCDHIDHGHILLGADAGFVQQQPQHCQAAWVLVMYRCFVFLPGRIFVLRVV